jgi:outer membrane protein
MTFAAAVAGLLVVSAPLAAQTAPTKIGYIDTRRVIQEAPGAQEARTTLEREMTGWQTQLKAMEDSLQTMVSQYQSQSVMLSADAKKQKESEIMAKRSGFEQRAQSLQEVAGRRQEELMKPIMDRVQAAITDIRTTQGYAIIFDVASEAFVAADPALDITQAVIDRLKAAAPTAAANR